MLFSPDDKQRIIGHMNEDHSDSNLIYVKVWGGEPNASAAELLDIEADHIKLKAQISDITKLITIPLEPVLTEVSDAEKRLVAMHFQGKEKLA